MLWPSPSSHCGKELTENQQWTITVFSNVPTRCPIESLRVNSIRVAVDKRLTISRIRSYDSCLELTSNLLSKFWNSNILA